MQHYAFFCVNSAECYRCNDSRAVSWNCSASLFHKRTALPTVRLTCFSLYNSSQWKRWVKRLFWEESKLGPLLVLSKPGHRVSRSRLAFPDSLLACLQTEKETPTICFILMKSLVTQSSLPVRCADIWKGVCRGQIRQPCIRAFSVP